MRALEKLEKLRRENRRLVKAPEYGLEFYAADVTCEQNEALTELDKDAERQSATFLVQVAQNEDGTPYFPEEDAVDRLLKNCSAKAVLRLANLAMGREPDKEVEEAKKGLEAVG